jgi:hypothetical protein
VQLRDAAAIGAPAFTSADPAVRDIRRTRRTAPTRRPAGGPRVLGEPADPVHDLQHTGLPDRRDQLQVLAGLRVVVGADGVDQLAQRDAEQVGERAEVADGGVGALAAGQLPDVGARDGPGAALVLGQFGGPPVDVVGRLLERVRPLRLRVREQLEELGQGLRQAVRLRALGHRRLVLPLPGSFPPARRYWAGWSRYISVGRAVGSVRPKLIARPAPRTQDTS